MIVMYVCKGLLGNMHRPGLNKLSYASTVAARVKRQLTCLTCDSWVERHGPLVLLELVGNDGWYCLGLCTLYRLHPIIRGPFMQANFRGRRIVMI